MIKIISPKEYKERLNMSDTEFDEFQKHLIENYSYELQMFGNIYIVFADISKDDDSFMPISEIGG